MASLTTPAPTRPEPGDGPRIRGTYTPDPRTQRWQRWSMVGITVVPLAALVIAIVRLWGTGISGLDLGLLLGFYAFTGLGITVGYHRLFTHKSFTAAPSVRLVLAIAGSMAIQGSLIDWVATHRRHHAFSDEVGDPHSPHLDPDASFAGILRGLLHAHLGWMFGGDGTDPEVWAPDLLDDPMLVKVSRAFPWLLVASFLAPAVLGGLLSWSVSGALTGLLWGGFVRVFLLHHVTWSINSICHFFGTRPFDSHDEARNNLVMALLGFGEGWHNAHHAFPASARHGLRWWEVDLSWITIRSLQLVGLVRDVKLPSPSQLQRRSRRARAAA